LFIPGDAWELVSLGGGGSSPTLQKDGPHTTSVIAPRMQSQEKERKKISKNDI
jgi:hypothetical protein